MSMIGEICCIREGKWWGTGSSAVEAEAHADMVCLRCGLGEGLEVESVAYSASSR